MRIALFLQGRLDALLNRVKRREDRCLFGRTRQSALWSAKQGGVATHTLCKRVKRGCG